MGVVVSTYASSVRVALTYGRWAARHPRLGTLVLASEFLVVPAMFWLLFGLWAGLVVLGVVIVFLTLVVIWVQRARRRRGLPPLPSLWRNQAS
jgi:uncharacterized membrane protein YedE/YeeE